MSRTPKKRAPSGESGPEGRRYLPAEPSKSLLEALGRKGAQWTQDDFDELIKWLCVPKNQPGMLACTGKQLKDSGFRGRQPESTLSCHGAFLTHFHSQGLKQAFFRKYDPGFKSKKSPEPPKDPVVSFSRYFLSWYGPLKTHTRRWVRQDNPLAPPPSPVDDEGSEADPAGNVREPGPGPAREASNRAAIATIETAIRDETYENRLLWWAVMYYRLTYKEAIDYVYQVLTESPAEQSVAYRMTQSAARVRVNRINQKVRSALEAAGYGSAGRSSSPPKPPKKAPDPEGQARAGGRRKSSSAKTTKKKAKRRPGRKPK